MRLDAEAARRSPRRPAPPSSTWFVKTRSAGQSSRSAATFASTYAARSARGEVLEQPRLEPLVAVEHEHGQQAAGQLGPDDARAAEVVLLRGALLADDRHVVPGEAPLPRERARVDVRAGAAEQVAVPERMRIRTYVRWKYSACSSSTAGFEVCTVTSAGTSSSASL